MVDMNVFIEPSPQKRLSTGEADVANGQASGKQKWDVVRGPASVGGLRAVYTLAKKVLGRTAVRMSHSLSFSFNISNVVSWPSVSPNTRVEEDGGGGGGRWEGKTMRPNMHCQHPVNLVGLQPALPV